MSGGGSAQTTTVRELAPEQQQLLDLAIPAFERFLDPDFQAGLIPPGSTVAPLTADQLAGQASVRSAAGTSAGVGQQSADAFRFLTTDALNPQSNPVIQDIIAQATRNITDTLSRDILPAIGTEAQSVGQVGSSRQGIAQGLAGEGAVRAVGDTTTNILNQAFQQGLQSAGFALTQAPTVNQALFAPGTALSAVGAENQGQEQALLDERLQRDLLPFLLAQQVSGAAFGIPAGQVTSTGSPASATPSLGGSILGGAATGAGIGSLVPGLGTGVGAGIGALIGVLGGI